MFCQDICGTFCVYMCCAHAEHHTIIESFDWTICVRLAMQPWC